ncbi:MAG TPA: alpha/beta fold hydrolase [Gemmatimonadales bacterium]|nr:alpha/beta fold hydrolase [Gemmatimonadales bacterium]
MLREYLPASPSVRLPAIVASLLVLASELSAQQPADDMLVIMTGSDTIAVERVRRTPNRLDGELLLKQQKVRISYAAKLVGVGRVISLDNEFRRGDADLSSKPLQTVSFMFLGDSAIAEIKAGDAPVQNQRIKTEAGAFPYTNPSFALLEPAIATALASGKDSTSLPVFYVQGGRTLPMAVVMQGPDSVKLTFAPGQDAYLKIRKDGAILRGGVPSQKLTVTRERATGAALFVPPPDYSAPADAPYTATNVTIPTPMGHTLAGTLTVPKGKGPFPAIVTITGSGAQDRDEEISLVKGFRPFRQVADSLGREGIAVLRMDDRGFGGSGGNVMTATSRDFADDIEAGLAWLRTRPEIDGKRLGLVGHSEGGLIAPIVASEDPTLKGIVLLAGPSQTGQEILEFQNRYAIEHNPQIKPEARDSAFKVAQRGIDSATKASPWLGFFAKHNPRETAAKVKVPALILQGATDQQVTAVQAEDLAKAFRSGGNKDVTVKVFPNANHLFIEDPVGNPAGYTSLTSNRIRDDVMVTLVGWLKQKLLVVPAT